jgi:hypothetical protein
MKLSRYFHIRFEHAVRAVESARHFFSSLIVPIILASVSATAQSAVFPLSEAEQALEATRIIDQFHSARPLRPPKKLHVVYFTPSDRAPDDHYAQRLEAILEDIRRFYGQQMERLGFEDKTFLMDRDARGNLIIHIVKGKEPASAFLGWKGRNGGNTGAESGDIVKREVEPVLRSAGIHLDQETVLIFCNLATYDPVARTFRHRSPYFGSWSQQGGLCFAADWGNQKVDNLTLDQPTLDDAEYGKMSVGKHTSIFIGGIAHELGHAFALPHCGERWDEKIEGASLLGGGNHTYREELRHEGKGSFLTMASAIRLAGRPLFNHSDKAYEQAGQLAKCDLLLSTNLTRADLMKRKGKLRVEGVVRGSPPVYGVIAYFDSSRTGGYDAPTSSSVPDPNGNFAIEISDLKPTTDGELRLEVCHANGAISERRLAFNVTKAGDVDLSPWEARNSLQELADAVGVNDTDRAKAALETLEHSAASDSAKQIGRKLAATIQDRKKTTPAETPASIASLPLGDAKPDSAQVGWLAPASNRIPANREITSALLDSGTVFATGLYAHSPSRYVFELGGNWKRLRGEAGLHSFHQLHGAVLFIIQADHREVFRSPTIHGASKAKYDIDLTGVKKLELITEKAQSGNGGNWALWLNPILFR